ncbi:outer membrane autotransporter barrel domain protein [Sutterella sp. CAG:521]|nr:outer membrane autotransporter barrel domain protein [Sutterella sp. CAG:521]
MAFDLYQDDFMGGGRIFSSLIIPRKYDEKTLLATALMLVLSSTAMAIEISGQETVESEFKKPAYTNETINLTDGAELTVKGRTNQVGLLQKTTVEGQKGFLILNVISTNDGDINAALGDGGSNIKVNRLDITSEGRGIYSSNLGGPHYIEANDISIIAKDDAIYTEIGDITIKGTNSVELVGNEDSYGIQNNSKGTVSVEGKSVNIEGNGRAALSNYAGGQTSITADNITITANNLNLLRKGAVYVKSGEVQLNANQSITITDTAQSFGTSAVYSDASTTLAINAPKITVNGNITTSGETQLDGELVFNGDEATIKNLTGDEATFTITKTDQNVSINNNNNALTLAATGDVNDEVGLDALKKIQLDGTKNGVQIIAHEGMYAQETTAVLDENGNMTNIVTKENSVMSNVLGLASATTLSLNRILMNDVRKRMGDLRSSEGTHGVWARYDGGSLSGSNGLENDFTTIQIGADTILGADVPRLGVAFAYTTSDGDMKRGDAEMDAYSLALYATKFYDSGMFYDVIGRVAKADTDVTIDGYKKGSMDNLAVSLSGEFGWRFDVTDSFYVEPQTELTYTYIDSDKLTLSSGHEYKVDSLDSLVGRVGFAAGFKCPSNYGDMYVRASAVHEFLGDATVHGGDVIHEVDGEDTWVEFGLGANFNINRSTYVYADIERTEGAAIDEDWRANIGVRYSF